MHHISIKTSFEYDDFAYIGPRYEELNQADQYLDYSYKSLGIQGIIQLFKDIRFNYNIKHLNLSYNIDSSELFDPKNYISFLTALRNAIEKTTTLNEILAIDLAGNHLFEQCNTSTSKHIYNYTEELADIFCNSTVAYIDLSNNHILGNSNRMLKGLTKLMRFYNSPNQGKGFTCRNSNLHSLSFKCIATGLGNLSSMTYLDLSDNIGGKDPCGNHYTEGISALASQLSQSLYLQVLNLARNHLNDEEIILIANAVHSMYSMKVLDLSGNNCLTEGCIALKEAIISHSAMEAYGSGLNELDLSGNPIGYEGVSHIAEALGKNDTLKSLKLSNCEIDDDGMKVLQAALSTNKCLTILDISHNISNKIFVASAQAESQANQLILNIREDPLIVNADRITEVVHIALIKKLRFLEVEILRKLHQNSSFTKPKSLIAETLFLLCPPERSTLLDQVIKHHDILRLRLEESKTLEKKVNAQFIIYRFILKWKKYRDFIKRAEQLYVNENSDVLLTEHEFAQIE